MAEAGGPVFHWVRHPVVGCPTLGCKGSAGAILFFPYLPYVLSLAALPGENFHTKQIFFH